MWLFPDKLHTGPFIFSSWQHTAHCMFKGFLNEKCSQHQSVDLNYTGGGFMHLNYRVYLATAT